MGRRILQLHERTLMRFLREVYGDEMPRSIRIDKILSEPESCHILSFRFVVESDELVSQFEDMGHQYEAFHEAVAPISREAWRFKEDWDEAMAEMRRSEPSG